MFSIRPFRRSAARTVTLTIAGLVAVAGLPVPSVALAVSSNTLRIEAPSVTGAGVGDIVSLRVVGHSAGLVSGTSATIPFDSARLHVTAVAKGADWVTAGAGWAGFPTTANTATFIANANAAGKVPLIAAFFTDGSTTLAAGDHDLLTITFQAVATGTATIDLPVGPADGGMIDGAVATYGNGLPVTSTGGSVTIVAKPTAAITTLPLWQAATAIAAHWSGTPAGAAIVSFDVRYRRAAWNGSFGALTPWLSATALSGASLAGSAGYTYCLSVRAHDGDGLISNWTAETCTAIPLDDRSLTRTGSWIAGTGSAFYRATYLRSTALGATLTRTLVKARRIAIVATTCATCGTIRVYWGATLLRTISLYSATTLNRKLITVTVFTSVRTGTLVLKVASSGRKVIVDGVAIRPN